MLRIRRVGKGDNAGERRRLGAALLLLGALSATAMAAADGERPKIGLALGGGGAKGAAHVGVLEVLEELNVPVDYIAGTSIGAIVGGLYATGMSAAEIRGTLEAIEWDEVLRDKPPRRDLIFRRKEEDARYLFDFEAGLGRGGIKWPGGLISGQNLLFMLQALTLPVADIDDFDRLPIPFRAVATDANNGEMVVLGSGQLASAIRASMSLPAIFAAVELDGKLLIDGGLVRNLPVDVVREMGADVVIAVDLGAPLSSRDVDRSIVRIFEQTTRLLTRPNVEPQLRDADLAIIPAVSDYGTMDFDKVAAITDLGVEAARAKATELERFSLDAESYARHRELRGRPDPGTLPLGFVEFEGNRRVDDRIIDNLIRLETGTEMGLMMVAEDVGRLLLPGVRQERRRRKRGRDELDLRDLFTDMRRLYGLGDFESIDFRLAKRDGERGIVIQMREKPWGPNYLSLGLELASDADGDTGLGLLLNLTKTRLNARGGEWRNDLLLGEDRAFFSELYQPLDFRGRYFFAPRVGFEQRRPTLFADGQAVAELDVRRQTIAVDFGYQFDIYGEIRLGVERAFADVTVESGTVPIGLLRSADREDIDIGGIRFQAVSDRLDSATFPRRGRFGLLRFFFAREDLGSDDEYTKAAAGGSRYWSRGRHTAFARIAAGWSPGSKLPVYDEFTLGGFGSFSGFADDELRGQYLGVLRLGYYQRRWSSWYLGGFVEAGNVWQTSDEADLDNLITSVTLMLGKETMIGPLYLGFGQAEGGENKVYLVLGRTLWR